MQLANQEIISSTESHNPATVHDRSPGKGIHYGLTVLIELAENYYSDGCCLTSISTKHSLSLHDLLPIIYKMEEAGLIGRKTDASHSHWLFLKDEPYGNWIIESVSILKHLFRIEKSESDL